MVSICDCFRTGEEVPISGKYGYLRHFASGSCEPVSEDQETNLRKGDVFPPHGSCNQQVIWRLLQID